MAALDKDSGIPEHLVDHPAPDRNGTVAHSGALHADSTAMHVVEHTHERGGDMPGGVDAERRPASRAEPGIETGWKRVLALTALACMWTSAQAPLFLFGMFFLVLFFCS
jgi:hypothetical protein